jgi:hypothetical protein
MAVIRLHAREQVTNFKFVKPASDVWSMVRPSTTLLTGQFSA